MDPGAISSTNDLPGNFVTTRLDSCSHPTFSKRCGTQPKKNEANFVALAFHPRCQGRSILASETRETWGCGRL
jgi:hypothetical protein